MWGLMTVKGGFREFRGEGKVVDSGALSDRVDIGAASLHTGIGRRDEHLRSADFFDVEKFQEVSVIVTAATADKEPSTSRPTSTKGRSHPVPLPPRSRCSYLRATLNESRHVRPLVH